MTDYAALLPAEFYPNPFLSEPKDGSGPTRPGPCWEPLVNGYVSPHLPLASAQFECPCYRLTVGSCIRTRLRYNGTGQAQRWPRFSNEIAPVSLGMGMDMAQVSAPVRDMLHAHNVRRGLTAAAHSQLTLST